MGSMTETRNKTLIEWAPSWSKYVTGRYEKRVTDPETGLSEPQKVYAKCSHCGAEWQTTCASGQVRLHITRFAKVHLHQDIDEVPRVVRPLSKRGDRRPGRADS